MDTIATGNWLLKKLNSRGGSKSDYSDIVFGQVTSEKPLKIQISNNIILPGEFLFLSKNVQDYKERIKYKTDKGEDREQVVTIKNGLKKSDYVVLLKRDGGQEFFVLEKTAKGGGNS